ncbi:MAG: LysE family translocator, partial [Pseudomonadota bacterium]|nr:LysE family translocator [Pseudomonadota bacterium]
MSETLWIAFVLASLPVHFAPGPNNLLALSNGAAGGYARAHLAALGRLPGYALIFLVAALGLGAALSASALLFAALQVAGGLYLGWIGLGMLRAGLRGRGRAAPATAAGAPARARAEFLTAVANPKAVLFATAFYAQFLTPDMPGYAARFATMAAVSLTLESLAAGLYAAAGAAVGARAAAA